MTSSELLTIQEELRQAKIKDLDLIMGLIKGATKDLQEAIALKLDLRPYQKALSRLVQDYNATVTYYNRIEV